MNALNLKSDLHPADYAQQLAAQPQSADDAVFPTALPAANERRSSHRRVHQLRLTRPSDDGFHLFRIF
jgi:hypothetical protein